MSYFIDWSASNKVELSGTIFGLFYVWFSIRQNIYTWPTGIITSLIYCWVFFAAKFYAGMGLQVYYVVISIYGWWSWQHGGQNSSVNTKLHVSYSKPNLLMRLFMLNIPLTFSIYYLLSRYTDSPIAFGDAVTASLSIIATWMLARKKIENWLIWIFVDLVSIGLYLYRGLYPTAFLFAIYTVMAGFGFYGWRKDASK